MCGGLAARLGVAGIGKESIELHKQAYTLSSYQSTLGNGFPLPGQAEKASSTGKFCELVTSRLLSIKNPTWLREGNWRPEQWGWMEATVGS